MAGRMRDGSFIVVGVQLDRDTTLLPQHINPMLLRRPSAVPTMVAPPHVVELASEGADRRLSHIMEMEEPEFLDVDGSDAHASRSGSVATATPPGGRERGGTTSEPAWGSAAVDVAARRGSADTTGSRMSATSSGRWETLRQKLGLATKLARKEAGEDKSTANMFEARAGTDGDMHSRMRAPM